MIDDQDFCVFPLSGDIPSNPFRCRSETTRGPQSLLHAILAVSYFHAGRQSSRTDLLPFDVVDHQNTALKLYRDELDTYTSSQGPQLLDTVMVLFLSYVRRHTRPPCTHSIRSFINIKLVNTICFWELDYSYL